MLSEIVYQVARGKHVNSGKIFSACGVVMVTFIWGVVGLSGSLYRLAVQLHEKAVCSCAPNLRAKSTDEAIDAP